MSIDDLVDPKVLIMGVNAVATVLLWLRKPGESAGEEVKSLKGRVDVLDERMKHMPTTDELTELAGTVKAIQATLESQGENLVTVRNTAARIEDWIRTYGRRSK